MLSFPPSLKVYLAPGTVDMRKSFDGLATAARAVLEQDPWSGHLFVFCGRRRHIVKVLYSDGTGLWLIAKRLAKGTFSWPSSHEGQKSVELTTTELAALLGGLDLGRSSWKSWRQATERVAM